MQTEKTIGNVQITRKTCCDCFRARQSILPTEPICWFCRYAKFDMLSEKLPEKGTCQYPEIQIV